MWHGQFATPCVCKMSVINKSHMMSIFERKENMKKMKMSLTRKLNMTTNVMTKIVTKMTQMKMTMKMTQISLFRVGTSRPFLRMTQFATGVIANLS